MRFIKTTLFSMILFFSFIFSAEAEVLNESQQVQLFVKANEAYHQQKFSDAKNKYEELVDSGLTNGNLYYNLANCYVKLNNNGLAMAYYLKAKELNPRDADIDSNL